MTRTRSGSSKTSEIDRSGLERRVKVGRDLRLYDPKIRQRLPAHHTTLHQLACLDDDALSEALASGIVHPEMTRAALAAWIKGRRQDNQGNDRNVGSMSPEIHITIRLPSGTTAAARHELYEALIGECKSVGAEITIPEIDDEFDAADRETERTMRRVDAFLRRAGRKLIREMKRQRLKGRPRNTTKADWQQQNWPYPAEEIEIGRAADLARVREVLHRLDMADEFAKALAEAYRQVREVRP